MSLINLVNQEGAYVTFGLSTDTKPSSPDNSLFVETDTALMYISSSGTWVIKTTGANLSLTDITTNNATTGRHGFLPKLDGLTTTFLRGDGTFATPAGAGSFSENETPGGAMNNSNVTFTLANTPTANSLKLYMNGLRQKYTGDYTLSGTTITMVSPPTSSDWLLADYRY